MLARKRRYEAGCMLISPPRLKRPFRYMKFKSSWLDDGWYNRSCPFACRRNETKVQLREPLSADSEHVHVRSRAKIAVREKHQSWMLETLFSNNRHLPLQGPEEAPQLLPGIRNHKGNAFF